MQLDQEPRQVVEGVPEAATREHMRRPRPEPGSVLAVLPILVEPARLSLRRVSLGLGSGAAIAEKQRRCNVSYGGVSPWSYTGGC